MISVESVIAVPSSTSTGNVLLAPRDSHRATAM